MDVSKQLGPLFSPTNHSGVVDTLGVGRRRRTSARSRRPQSRAQSRRRSPRRTGRQHRRTTRPPRRRTAAVDAGATQTSSVSLMSAAATPVVPDSHESRSPSSPSTSTAVSSLTPMRLSAAKPRPSTVTRAGPASGSTLSTSAWAKYANEMPLAVVNWALPLCNTSSAMTATTPLAPVSSSSRPSCRAAAARRTRARSRRATVRRRRSPRRGSACRRPCRRSRAPRRARAYRRRARRRVATRLIVGTGRYRNGTPLAKKSEPPFALTSSASAPARPRARVDERRVRASGRGAAAASATPRAATGGQHQGIYVSRQHASNRLEHRNIRTRACAFSLFNRLAVDRSTGPLALSLLRSDYL